MFEFIRDSWQDKKIRENSLESERAMDVAQSAYYDHHDQQKQIEHLTLLCQSMWELLRDTTGLTDDQLRHKVSVVDSRDGHSDGKISKQVFACPRCGKNCNSTNDRCVMCGADLRLHKPHIFEG